VTPTNNAFLDVTGNTALYGGAAATVGSVGFGLSEAATVTAMLVAVAGFALNVWVTYVREKRERDLHKLKLEQVQAEIADLNEVKEP
jgi:uncharacterized membrane protein YhiD involved in acid resistance